MKQSGMNGTLGLFARNVPDTTWSMKALEGAYVDKNSSVRFAAEHGALSLSPTRPSFVLESHWE
ncbi:hypothetical protein [Agrobacterium arsenijevicii]|uniref:Uncharacterized protein n=1 Tax=Agrobacterium arsenijevicii TaxID=1585697 RepID=A0ABR5D0R0_9HYPH|nr:hypothetical protein RP75_25260 [Agrobacterium arsenijevicii]